MRVPQLLHRDRDGLASRPVHVRAGLELGGESIGSVVSDRNKDFFDFFLRLDLGVKGLARSIVSNWPGGFWTLRDVGFRDGKWRRMNGFRTRGLTFDRFTGVLISGKEYLPLHFSRLTDSVRRVMRITGSLLVFPPHKIPRKRLSELGQQHHQHILPPLPSAYCPYPCL